jgi:methylmalonyl-CoA/ethylmalonyl-CoA epimerase
MLPLTSLDHIGYVVPDAGAAIAELQRAAGLPDGSRGSFDATWERALFRGEPVTFSASYTFLSLGNTDIEVIEPRDATGPYCEFLGSGAEGVHHLAFVVESIDEHVAAAPGATLLFDHRLRPGVRFAYVQGMLRGVLVELIEAADGA